MPLINKDELYIYNGAHRANIGKKTFVGGSRDEELLSEMNAIINNESLDGKTYYIMSTYLCLRGHPDEYYRNILQQMLEIVSRKMRREASDMIPDKLTKDFVQTTIDNTFTEENIARIVNENIGPINANNYIGKLNLVILYSTFLFDKNVGKETSVNTGIEILENFDDFTTHLFNNWIQFHYYKFYYSLFFVLDIHKFVPEIKTQIDIVKRTGMFNLQFDDNKQIELNRQIESVYHFENMEQYHPNTPQETYVYLIHIVALFSLGVIVNGYLNRILYLGFTPKNKSADGILYGPVDFLQHDVDHSDQFLGISLPPYGTNINRWIPEVVINAKKDCRQYIDNNFVQFYRRCERAHGSNPITGNEMKHSDLFKVQLIIFMMLHEASSCDIYKDKLNAYEEKRLMDKLIFNINAREEKRFMVGKDLNGLIPSDINNDNAKIKKYLDAAKELFMKKVKTPDTNFAEQERAKQEQAKQNPAKKTPKQNPAKKTPKQKGGKTARKSRTMRRMSKYSA